MKKRRILTGHRPTGPRHIGHLVGTLETWAQLQDSHECFFLVADLHVLTAEEVYGKMGLLHSQTFSEKVLANNIAGVFC